jgi:hypothetical protein
VGPDRYSFIHGAGLVAEHSRLLAERDFIKCISKSQGTVFSAKQEEEITPFSF